eukprot:10064863-Alexandrium_andersonii.AAC.1
MALIYIGWHFDEYIRHARWRVQAMCGLGLVAWCGHAGFLVDSCAQVHSYHSTFAEHIDTDHSSSLDVVRRDVQQFEIPFDGFQRLSIVMLSGHTSEFGMLAGNVSKPAQSVNEHCWDGSIVHD